jgi:DNA-binding FadR family transcriptional regulator
MANAVSRLLKYIEQSDLKAGDKIPSERTLAVNLAISRASLREAIKSLNVSGFIETHLGDGSYIRAKTPSPPVLKPDFTDFSETPQYCFDVLEIRKALECNSAFDAALNATTQERKAIKTAFENLMLATRNKDPILEARYDAEFHLSIVQASHNKVLYFMYQQLFEILQSSIGNFLKSFYPSDGEDNLSQQHQTIFDAIMANDAEAAREAALAHTQSIIKIMHQNYEE